MENKGLKKICLTVSVVLAALLVVLVGVSAVKDAVNAKKYQSVASEYLGSEEQKQDETALTILGTSTVEIKELASAEISISPSDFANNAEYARFNNKKVTCNTAAKFLREDKLLFYFEAKAQSQICDLTVEIYNSINTMEFTAQFTVGTQLSAYYIPLFEFVDIENIVFEITKGSGAVEIKNATVFNNKKEDIPEKLSGVFNIEEVKAVVSQNPDLAIGGVVDVVSDGKYLYAATTNKITIASISNPASPSVVGEVEDIGLPRRMIKVNDSILAVACREYGVYLIDVTNPAAPKKVGHIDTLELASGLDAKGNYLFIASRYYGIEIYDISNPAEPKYINYLRSDVQCERIDCVSYGDFLYAGVWNSKRVEVFDIRNLLDPRYVGYVEVQGTVYGLDVYKDKLVVASGFHSSINESKDKTDIGYGGGNAMTVFDLKHPERPSLITSTAADGKYYNVGSDYWDVRVFGDLAFYNDMHNGLYVYDLTNTKKLTRVCKMTTRYNVGSAYYKSLGGDASVFSFDKNEYIQGCINGMAMGDGYVYLAETNGIHVMKFDKAKYTERESFGNYSLGKAPSEKNYSSRYLDVTKKKFDGQTFAVAQNGDYIFVGTTGGIQVLDLDMNSVEFYETRDAVRDLKIVNSKLYTAESQSGVAIYSISGKELNKLGSYKTPIRSKRIGIAYQIGVSPDGKYVITTCGMLDMVILNAAVPQSISLAGDVNIGSVYYREISQSAVNSNTLYISHTAGVTEVVFKNGSYTQNTYSFDNISIGTIAPYKDGFGIAIGNGGYRVLDLSEGIDKQRFSEVVKISGWNLKGYPIIKDNIMVLTNASTGNVAVIDITNVYEPVVKGYMNINGNCDMSFIASDGSIFVPSRYEGLIKITVTD